MTLNLLTFMTESNAIEGIHSVRGNELDVLRWFLTQSKIEVVDLEVLVGTFQPDAKLRRAHGMDVHIVNGYTRPPPGGIQIESRLSHLLGRARVDPPYQIHGGYEYLHPFTDGNGRSGRALWLWHCRRDDQRAFECAITRGFLVAYYYQSLQYGLD